MGGHLVHYRKYESLPHLLVYHLCKPFPLPVDQNLVRVAKDGEDLIFYIRVHMSELSDLFRPFIWAGSLQRPQIKKTSDPASSLAFRQFMAHEQVRRHTSLTPSSNSQKQWVETNRSLLTDSVFLKKNMFCFFWKKHVFFQKKTLLKKKQGSKCFFFSKPPVFKVNIHNLSQFVNHTVTLVQNKNNNERISLKWGLCGYCLKKNIFFFKRCLFWKKDFSQDLFFLFSYFFLNFF